MANYDEITKRWAARERWGDKRPNLTTPRSRIIAEDGVIYSYGSHFPMARTLRNKRGEFVAFLVNGDTFSNTTSKHQSYLRSAIRGSDSVTIPFSVLDEAGITQTSVEIIDVTEDRTERWIERHTEFPASAEWWYEGHTIAGTGGYLVDGTFYTNAQCHYWHGNDPLTPEHRAMFANRIGRWDYELSRMTEPDPRVVQVPAIEARTGRKTLTQKRGHGVWELVWDEENQRVVYEIERSRHWLGESLIRAEVRYFDGTWRKRKAYFLSGFDANETRPSYFFCELPRGVRPTTVAEAYETLKPGVVKFAESMALTVERQGDIFAVPTTLTLKDLKAMGGKHHKREVEKLRRWNGSTESIPSAESYVLGTNHTASEVVTVGRLTYARGTLRHEPDGRRPDHARIRLADGKTWMILVKNTVPTARAGRARRTANA